MASTHSIFLFIVLQIVVSVLLLFGDHWPTIQCADHIDISKHGPMATVKVPPQAPCLVAGPSCPYSYFLSQGQEIRNLTGPYRDPLSLLPSGSWLGPAGISRSEINVCGLMDTEAFLFQAHHKSPQTARTLQIDRPVLRMASEGHVALTGHPLLEVRAGGSAPRLNTEVLS